MRKLGIIYAVCARGQSYDPSKICDSRYAFDRVFHARKKSLDVEVEFGELFFEELELCDHGVEEQIKGGVLSVGTQALLCRLSERFCLLRAKSTAAGADEQALEPAQGSRAIAAALGATLSTAWAALL